MPEFADRLARLCLGSPMPNFPKRPADVDLLLQSIAAEFGQRVRYSEQDADARILGWLRDVGRRIDIDHVNIRRRLIDDGYLVRSRDGSEYRLGDQMIDTDARRSREIIRAAQAEREARRRERSSQGR